MTNLQKARGLAWAMGEFRNWIENWTAIGPKDRAVVLAAANTIRDLAEEVERLRERSPSMERLRLVDGSRVKDMDDLYCILDEYDNTPNNIEWIAGQIHKAGLNAIIWLVDCTLTFAGRNIS